MKARYLQGKVGIWVSRESRPTVSTVSRKQSTCAHSSSTTNAPLQTQAAWGRGQGEGRDRCPEATVLRVPAPGGRDLPTELGQQRRPRWHQSAFCGSCHCPSPLLLPLLPKIRVPLCACGWERCRRRETEPCLNTGNGGSQEEDDACQVSLCLKNVLLCIGAEHRERMQLNRIWGWGIESWESRMIWKFWSLHKRRKIGMISQIFIFPK